MTDLITALDNAAVYLLGLATDNKVAQDATDETAEELTLSERVKAFTAVKEWAAIKSKIRPEDGGEDGGDTFGKLVSEFHAVSRATSKRGAGRGAATSPSNGAQPTDA